MRTPQQTFIDRAVIRQLLQCGSFSLPQRVLKDGVDLAVGRFVTQADFEESLRYLDSHQRVQGMMGETDCFWQITRDGRMWANAERISA